MTQTNSNDTQEITGKLEGKDRTEELRKRQIVFTRPQDVVMIKIYAQGAALAGFSQRHDVDPATASAARLLEASGRNLNATGVRGEGERTDLGFPVFGTENQKEQGVRGKWLLDQLTQRGLRPVNCYWYKDARKGIVNVVVYNRDGEPIELPRSFKFQVESRRFNDATIWANLRMKDFEEGQTETDIKYIRLDTVGLAKGIPTDQPGRQLVLQGNTYRLLEDGSPPPAELADTQS